MYREVLSSIEGIEIYPIVSLLIFFAFFVGVLAWFVLADKDRLERWARLPLDEDIPETRPRENGAS